MEQIRIDKYLWCVRVFKTRSQATDACRASRVKVDGYPVKPSRIVNPGDIITVSGGPYLRTYRIRELLDRRVGSKLVTDYLDDITPVEEIEKYKQMKDVNYEHREKGDGRPTKKQRREIVKLKIWKRE